MMNLTSILGAKARPKIFICYRRTGEGAGFGGRIADKLVEHFGARQCFRDIENIEKGTDFVKSIAHATSICELLLVIIGPDWLTLKDKDGQVKIQDKNDFVRLEVATALSRDIRVIPVLVGGAKVPKEDELPKDLKLLSRRQSHELADTRWEYDSNQLIKSIEAMGIRGSTREAREAQKRKQKVVVSVILTIAVIASVFLIGRNFIGNSNKNTNNKFETLTNRPAKVEKTNAVDLRDNKVESVSPTGLQPVANEVKKPNYSRERGSIKSAISLASNLEIRAFLTLNEKPLRKVLKGDALRMIETVLEEYRLLGFYDINILESQSFGELNIYPQGRKLLAEVELFETWSGHTHSSYDNACLTHRASRENPQTVYLEKDGDSWFITSIIQHNTAPVIPTTCGQYNCPLL